jgi:hypothetical protein
MNIRDWTIYVRHTTYPNTTCSPAVYATPVDHAATPAQLPEVAVGEAEMAVLLGVDPGDKPQVVIVVAAVVPVALVIEVLLEVLLLVELLAIVVVLVEPLAEHALTERCNMNE